LTVNVLCGTFVLRTNVIDKVIREAV